MTTDPNERQKEYAQIIAKAWADENFKNRLLKEPAAVLKEHRVQVPDGVDIRTVENTPNLVHFVLPAKPADALDDEQLEDASGGTGRFSCSFSI